MKLVGVIPNLEKDQDLSKTKKILEILLSLGCVPHLLAAFAETIGMGVGVKNAQDLYKNMDFLLTLGGDGTLLAVSHKASPYQTPLMGVNLGTLGYLTDVEFGCAKEAICKVVNGEYQLEKRLMLQAETGLFEQKRINGHALNDICITRGASVKTIVLKVCVNEEYLDTYRADGIIISTPTGSTAYNLSAGGPILKPDSEVIAITPICPHGLYSRSIVLSAQDTVTITAEDKGKNEGLFLSIDGQQGIPLQRQAVVRVSRSPYTTSIIKTNPYGFYDILRKKLGAKGGGSHEDCQAYKDIGIN